MPERSTDWIKQARRDLEAARRMAQEAFFEWACFVSQQAAEKAVKAVFQKLGGLAWGHSVFELLRALQTKVKVGEEILDCARTLDKFYVPARYPNGFAAGSPFEYFTEKEAENALFCAGRIVEFCEGILAREGRAPEGPEKRSRTPRPGE
ncbi:HEPN domain protein [Ammonifex degensii KC4]|uniref:HEPN domain protein n=2 Tax=Ammonifex degensii TaxID=42838 RepID=C9RBN9_AMMDK|nr:HEPN domain protein [Ammonifex degensii KC4]